MATNNETINLKIQVDANQAQQSTVNYKAKIKELKDQMAALSESTDALANATEEQKQAYIDAAVEAARMKDALGDINTQIQVLSDDYLYFNTTLDALKGGTAVVQGLVGTMDLLGISNTGVEQVVKTMVSLQGIMNSLNAVQQLFNKDSRIRIVLEKLLTTQTKQKAKAEATSAVALTAEGAATKGATAATRSFTAALMANPIFMMATVVIGVTTAIIGLTGVLDDNTDSVEENTGATDENTTSWSNNAAARREAMKGYGEMLSTIESSGSYALDKEGALLEFVRVKLGVHIKSVQEAREVYNDFKKATDGITQSMEVFYKEGTQVHKEITHLKDAAMSYTFAQERLANAKAAFKRAAEEGASQDVLDDLDEEVQMWERNTRYAEQMLSILEEKTVGYYKDLIKKKNETGKATSSLVKKTTDDEIKSIVDLDEMRRRINEEADKDREKSYEGKRKLLVDEVKMTEDAFEQEKEDMKQYFQEIDENGKSVLNNDAYEEWLDLRETQVSQHLAKINENIDALDKEENQKRFDREKQVQKEINELQLNSLEEGSKEYYQKKAELENVEWEIEKEELKRRLDDELITKEEYDLLYEEKKKEHIKRLQEMDDGEKEHKIAIFLDKLDAISHYTEQAEKIVQASSNFVMALQDAELENAEGDEKKQKEIKKKYAVANMVMTIGQIAVETIMGSVAALANGIRDMGMPIGAIVGGVTAALVTATGIAATVKAVNEKNNIMKMARGGYVVGASHTAGGVNYELEGGEIVLNKNVARIPQYRAIASAMNVSTGGIPLGGGGLENGAGFGVTKEDVQTIVQETVAGIAAIPVVVSAQTISEKQRRVNVTEQRSQI